MGGEKKRDYILSQQQKLHKKFANAKKYGALTAMVFNPVGFLSCASRGGDEEYRRALATAHPGILATEGKGRCNLCPSHPATRAFVASGVKELVETFPELDMIVLQFSDMGGELFCACDKCNGYPLPDRIVDYTKLVMDTARKVNPHILFMMREHGLPGYIGMQQPEYRDDPTKGFKEITRRLGKDMEAIIMRVTTPPGGDFQNWFSPDSTMLGQGVPLYFLFHYYEAGGPGVIAPLSPVESHLSWALLLYVEKLRKFIKPGQGLVGCTSSVAGMEVAYWHPDLDADKYARNWCMAKYGADAGDYVYQAIKETDKITSAFFLQPGCEESFDLYRWGDYDKPWATDMGLLPESGFGWNAKSIANAAIFGFMQPTAEQPKECKQVTRANLPTWDAKFQIPEVMKIATRSVTMSAKALEKEPSNGELQRIHMVAVATDELVQVFRDYHLALIYANAAKNERAMQTGSCDNLVAQSRVHLANAINHLAKYATSYREIAAKSDSFSRLAIDIRYTYLPGIILIIREACYLFDKDFGGDHMLQVLDERLHLTKANSDKAGIRADKGRESFIGLRRGIKPKQKHSSSLFFLYSNAM